MKLKFVIPNMEGTFGNLEFASAGNIETRRVNGKASAVTREYHLYSDKQRADDVIVSIPGKAGEKQFAYEDKVKLINPHITAEGLNIAGRGYTDYKLFADDIVKVE